MGGPTTTDSMRGKMGRIPDAVLCAGGRRSGAALGAARDGVGRGSSATRHGWISGQKWGGFTTLPLRFPDWWRAGPRQFRMLTTSHPVVAHVGVDMKQ